MYGIFKTTINAIDIAKDELMRKSILLILLFINVGVFADTKSIGDLAKLASAGKQSGHDMQSGMPYPSVNVIEVFNIFLDAVDRGQLILFEQSLSRDKVMPIRVEYVYTAEVPYPIVKVYSELKNPMPLPSMPDAKIVGVSSVMDSYGNIIETTAHCDINE